MLFSPKNIAFGLDIGDKTIKLVELRRIKNLRGKERLVLVSFNEVSAPAGVMINGEIKNPPAVINAIKSCVKGVKGKFLSTRAVVASLPESQSYLKIISLPKNPVKGGVFNETNKKNGIKRNDVERLISQHFPIEAEKLYFDWQPLEEGKIMLGAAPRNIVDSYANIIEQAGLIPLSLEIESLALSRALIDKKETNGGSKIFMDLGATRSAIIATYHNNPVVTLNIPLSGDSMTNEIAKSEKINFEKAEQLKLECGFDIKKCSPKIKKVINSILCGAIKEIDAGVRYISRLLQIKIDKIFICGGVSAMSKIASALSDGLKIKFRHADPLVNIVLSKKIKWSDDDILRYATAIGLAMRGTEPQALLIDNGK